MIPKSGHRFSDKIMRKEAGLVPGIHVFIHLKRGRRGWPERPALRRKETAVAEKVVAAGGGAPPRTEIRQFPMPDMPEDAALMKMEGGGIWGTDVKLYKHPPSNAPVIMGHENIGTTAKAGREFPRRKGFKEGDLVFVEHHVSCGKCHWSPPQQYPPSATT